MKLFSYLLPLFLVLALSTAVFATTGTSIASGIAAQLCQIKSLIVGIIPTIALIMFLLAGLVYAAGQTFGAEMKAKAQGWAMSLLVGGIVGIIIAVLAPLLVNVFINMGGGMAGGQVASCQ